MDNQALLTLVQRIAQHKLFEELPEKAQQANDAQYNWNQEASDAFESFIQEARDFIKDEPLVDPVKFTKLDQAERNLLVCLLYDKVDDYARVYRENTLAVSIMCAIDGEQDKLKRLANKIAT